MFAIRKFKHILLELKHHAPFTILGATLGIAFMLLFRNMQQERAHALFAVFHPSHVVLSAMVTSAIFRMHSKKSHFLTVLVIGYIGSIGVATLSDCVIPYFGEKVLGLHIPAHQHAEGDEPAAEIHDEHLAEARGQGHQLHLGFIEEWYLVNPAAVLGIILGFFLPVSRLPHAVHVLISTWASASYLLMGTHYAFDLVNSLTIFVILFIAVWLPCCISDIIFPLLFLKAKPHYCHTCKAEH